MPLNREDLDELHEICIRLHNLTCRNGYRANLQVVYRQVRAALSCRPVGQAGGRALLEIRGAVNPPGRSRVSNASADGPRHDPYDGRDPDGG